WTDCAGSARSTCPRSPVWRRMYASASPRNWLTHDGLDKPGPDAREPGLRPDLRIRGSRMAVPLDQAPRVGAYVLKQHLLGRKRYPLVLMLEPLFRCNLACAGCGKIDYPAEILNQRLSVAECMEAIEECGAPVVVLAGGEPLLHREIEQI